MKRIIYILPLVAIILLGGCKYFKKEQIVTNNVDSLLSMPFEDTLDVDTMMFSFDKDVYLLSEVNDKYLIIVGSFENVELAKTHANKYASFNLETKVIAKPDGFYMVSAKSFETKDAARKDLPFFRSKYAKKSWVFTNHRVVDMAAI